MLILDYKYYKWIATFEHLFCCKYKKINFFITLDTTEQYFTLIFDYNCLAINI